MKTIDDFVQWYNNGEFVPLLDFDVEGYAHEIDQAVKGKFFGEKPRNYIGASALSTPGLQLALKKLGFPKVNEDSISIRTLVIFHFGHVFESLIIYLMRAYGLKVSDTQLEVRHGEFQGHIDSIVGGNTLVEIKTMAPDYFKSFTAEPDDIRGYYTQLAFYHHCLKDRTTDTGWLCFDKGTFSIKFVRPDMDKLEYHWCKAKEKMHYLSITTQVEDILKFPLPECKEEVYKKEGTGKYLLPPSFRRSPYCSCFFNTYEGVDKYKHKKIYVDVDNPPTEEEIIQRLLNKKNEIETKTLIKESPEYNIEF